MLHSTKFWQGNDFTMMSTMGGSSPNTSTNSTGTVSLTQLHRANLAQQQQQQVQQQQQLQQANAFLTADPRLMDKNISQLLMTINPGANPTVNGMQFEEGESLTDRARMEALKADQDGFETVTVDNPYAESMDFFNLKNLSPRHKDQRPEKKKPYDEGAVYGRPAASSIFFGAESADQFGSLWAIA
jgi:hypothetical protein